jgi:hypothetical protein
MISIKFDKTRIEYENDKWALCYTVDIPADHLKFEDLHPQNSYVRQQDIARMHYSRAIVRGEDNPHILTWTAMQTDRRASHLFPNLNYTTDDGEQLISANSFITYVLRKLLAEGWLQLNEYISDTYEWQTKIPDQHTGWQAKADAIMKWLEKSIQLDLYPNAEKGTYQPRVFRSFNVYKNFVRIGRCDFIRNFVQSLEREAVFNTSYFLHEHDDLTSYHSGYGDAIGLIVAEKTILRPPIYNRGCLLYNGENWTIETIGMQDVTIIIPDDILLTSDTSGTYQFHLNPHESHPITVYTRAGNIHRNGQPLDRTPLEKDRIELVIVNRQVVSWKQGGGLRIPQNGFVLSVTKDALPQQVIDNMRNDAWIEYSFTNPERVIKQGLQTGPILLKDGAPVIHQALEKEDFWASRIVDKKRVTGISPVNMNVYANAGRKARTAIGIKPDGSLVLVVIDGCESDYQTPLDSAGATFEELTHILEQHRAIDALSLSGAGSTHLFVKGGLYNVPSERRGHHGIVYERMLPSIGVIS